MPSKTITAAQVANLRDLLRMYDAEHDWAGDEDHAATWEICDSCEALLEVLKAEVKRNGLRVSVCQDREGNDSEPLDVLLVPHTIYPDEPDYCPSSDEMNELDQRWTV